MEEYPHFGAFLTNLSKIKTEKNNSLGTSPSLPCAVVCDTETFGVNAIFEKEPWSQFFSTAFHLWIFFSCISMFSENQLIFKPRPTNSNVSPQWCFQWKFNKFWKSSKYFNINLFFEYTIMCQIKNIFSFDGCTGFNVW